MIVCDRCKTPIKDIWWAEHGWWDKFRTAAIDEGCEIGGNTFDHVCRKCVDDLIEQMKGKIAIYKKIHEFLEKKNNGNER
jgi:hypothetical protein